MGVRIAYPCFPVPNLIIRQPEDHDPFPFVSREEIVALDLIVEFQLLQGHERSHIVVCGIIKEQKNLPGGFIIGFQDPRHDLAEDLHGKGVEEITPVFTEVNSGVATEELQQPTSLQISWNQMHFNIATKKEAQLAAYFVHQLQSLC